MTGTFLGYPRPKGSFGIRNHVLVIAAMDNVNPVARRISAAVNGTLPICASFGRGQVAEDLEQHDMTLANYGRHPNCAAALVVGMEPASTRAMAERIAVSGKPVEWVTVQTEGGTLKTVAAGVRLASRLVAEAGRIARQPVPLGELVMGVECGASDATSGLTANATTGMVADWLVERGGTVILSETDEIVGAEKSLAARAINPQVARDLLDAVKRLEDQVEYLGIQLLPLGQDNVVGGLSTVEEKSLGAVRKGGTSPLCQVVGYGEIPTSKGLIFMDAPAPGTENTTAIAAGGAHLIVFNTGVGNPVCNPVSPTLKVTGNPRTAVHFADNIDVDVSGILTGAYDMKRASELLRAAVLDVANGAMTKGEMLGDVEIAISRVELGFVRNYLRRRNAPVH